MSPEIIIELEATRDGKLLELEMKAPSLEDLTFEIPCVLDEKIILVPCRVTQNWKFSVDDVKPASIKTFCIHDFQANIDKLTSRTDETNPPVFFDLARASSYRNGRGA